MRKTGIKHTLKTIAFNQYVAIFFGEIRIKNVVAFSYNISSFSINNVN